ncbi:MAG: DegT/DnrJ/EryC1/StrS family aminotransferase [Candidatus Riflebacteria bacterium]|nr:DegT/DnrJ/EryC1/StrS family aminotransferase [Candidatus Riflebacteria bacterium]
MSYKINWWRTSFGEEEINRVAQSIRSECVSQGKVTCEFERKLEELLQVRHVVAVSSGSVALLSALMAIGIKPGDEIIIPNRTWIATAHAVKLLGGKVVPVDVEVNRPIIDVNQISKAITSQTRAIIPVHMNGRSADMRRIREIAKKYHLFVIEDAAQAIASKNADGFLGTQSDIGCFSLSVAKTIATGQGGFVVTNTDNLAEKLRSIRTHGVENVKDPGRWVMQGFNFRFTDVLASIGIEQLKRLAGRLDYLRELYHIYESGLKDSPFKIIPVDIETGEIPVYNEFLVDNRQWWINRLEESEIETRPFYPNVDQADYLEVPSHNFPNSAKYSLCGIYLPSGPSQSVSNIRSVIAEVNNCKK